MVADGRVTISPLSAKSFATFPISETGIVFKDITPLLGNGRCSLEPSIFGGAMSQKIDTVLGIESRGFVVGAALAYKLGAGFCIVRKPGKLPYETHRASYELEYGTDALEIHVDAIRDHARVVIADDLIATGGTAVADGAGFKLARNGGGMRFRHRACVLKGQGKAQAARRFFDSPIRFGVTGASVRPLPFHFLDIPLQSSIR
jgi:adenine phosphoribosyltransferase